MWGGVGVGKSFTGAHFAIDRIQQMPGGTGFIGANTHDQLSQATLRELFYWLNAYGYQFCVDTRPPREWGCRREFKDYANVITIRDPLTKAISTVLARVMSNPDPIRGIELSWYWLDEMRDTEEYAYDMILGRLRETTDIRGIITTTTNGEDWLYKRVLKNAGNAAWYGSMHVPTRMAVKAGSLTEIYYQQMLASYTELMALQELEAKHVNIRGGRAYYAASELNRMPISPWGERYPNPDRPLIVGCDFNFSPAPCIWEVGQQDPYGERIHWYGEIDMKEASSPQMAMALANRFPGFFYRIFGDRSGNLGTTSNAGQTDYDQIGITLDELGCAYSIDVDMNNPMVKDRVENLNGLLKNAIGEVRCTYDPQGCPQLDGDMKMVGWKETTLRGKGRLDDGGDNQRTHASDGAGYAAWKLLPPGRRGTIGTQVSSPSIQRVSQVV